MPAPMLTINMALLTEVRNQMAKLQAPLRSALETSKIHADTSFNCRRMRRIRRIQRAGDDPSRNAIIMLMQA